MLETVELVKKYRKREVVAGVSLTVDKGEIVGLLGPNGAGKTTSFYMIVGLIKPDKGSIFHNRANITGLPMHRRAKLGIGYLPQEPSVFRRMTVEENILSIIQASGIPRGERKNLLQSLLEELSIINVRKNKAYQLSGGERRRTEIARALVLNPSYMLLDEPFAGVDPIAVEDIQNIILTLKKKGLGVLITDHNVRETLEITDRSYIMHSGKVLLSGDSHFLSTNAQARSLYLGERFKL